MAERKVVIMYKDVWKKFGAKILIVACSILLLGGVAIAAPRLRAAEDIEGQKFTAVDADSLAYISDTVPVFPKSLQCGSVIINYSGSENQAEQQDTTGKYIEYGNNIKLRLQDGNWTQATQNGAKIKIGVQFPNGNDDFSGTGICVYEIKPQAATSVDVELNNAEKYSEYNKQNRLMMGPLRALAPSDFKVTVVDGKGNQVDLTSSDEAKAGYEIYNTKDVTTQQKNPKPANYGSYTCYVKLKNYQLSDQYQQKAITITHHIKDYDVTVGGVVKTLNGDVLSEHPSTDSIKLKVKDGDDVTDSDLNGSYTVNSHQVIPGTNPQQYKITIEGSKDKCFGSLGLGPYTISEKMEQFVLVKQGETASNDSINTTVPYDEVGNTYRVQNMSGDKIQEYSLYQKKSTGYEKVATYNADSSDPTLPKWGSVVFDDSDCHFVKNGTPIPGATAGILQQKITVGGVTGYLVYRVSRELLVNGKLNERLLFDSPIDKETKKTQPNNTYEYDGEQHRMIPQMYFRAANGETIDETKKPYLELDRDYTLEWKFLQDDTSGTWGKDVGTVAMQITGKGLYSDGVLIPNGVANRDEVLQNARYRVTGQIVSKQNGFSVKLLDAQMEEKSNFILNTTARQIISSARLYKGEKGILYIEDAERDHNTTVKPSFFRKTAGAWTEVNIPNNNFDDFKFNAPGDYRVVFALAGNYTTPDGKGIELAEREISCDFTIDAFDITEYDFSVAGCEPDYNTGCDNEFVTGKNHIYNGKAHKPQVEMRKRIDNSLVDSINGELYSVHHYRYVTDPESTERTELTDAGKAIAYVQVVGYDLRKVEFTIEPRQLETVNIVFSEKDGFRNIEETTTSGAAIHPYNGKTPPEVTELGIRHEQIDRNVVLQVGNAENSKDFTIIEGLFDADGKSLTNIEITGQYYYKIKLTNPNYKSDNKQNTVLVGPFRFEAKDISKATVDPLVDVIGYDQYLASSANDAERGKASVDKYLKGEFQNKKLTVTDGNDVLVYGTDYVITSSGTNALKDLVNDDGTIVFTLTGKNCYTGETAKIILNVGTDIVGSTVYAQKNNDSISGARPDPATFGELRTAEIIGAYDAPTVSNPNVLDFLKKNETVTNDKTYLYLSGTTLLYEENYKLVSVNSEYDESTDRTYCILTISGKNGYYGNVSIKVRIRKRSLNSDNCTVEVLDRDYTYIGKGHRVPVQLKVMYGNVELKEGTDYEIWYDNTDNKAPIDATLYGFYLKGLHQYEDEKRGANQTYTIKPRNIATTVSGGAINNSKFQIDMAETYTYVKGGFRPVVKLKYRINEDDEWSELTGSDFKYTPFNTDHVSGSSEPNEEHARVVVEGIGNFCGNFTKLFNINPVDMEKDCRIEMSPSIYDFRAKDVRPADGNHGLGSNVTFVVRQRINNDVTIEGGNTGGDVTVDGDERWIAIDPDEYDTGYSGNYYVSGDFVTTSDGSEYTEPTSIKVTGLYDPQNPSKGGNYRGSLTRTFTIRGDLASQVADPANATNIFSKTVITKNEIPYSTLKDKQEGSTNIGNSGMEVQFQQQERIVNDQGIGEGAGTGGHYATRILKWGKDYEVYLTDINSSEPLGKVVPQVGIHSGRIEGKGNFIGKQEDVDVFITGNLGDDEETEVSPKQNGATLEDGIIVIRSDSTDIKLQDYISVKCGGRTLDYGKEYRFIEDGSSDKDAVPNMAPGQRSIRITYTNDSKPYLRGDRLIKYWVKQELDLEKYNVTGVEESYEYNHGSPVIDLDEVQVRYDTTLLKRDRDYTIEFEKNDGYSVNPEHKVIITPIGNYSGDAKKLSFAVTKYDLTKNQDQIKIDADSTTIYTGRDVFPTINAVVVKARIVSGGGVASNVNLYGEGDVDKPGFTEAAYGLRSVEGQDNVNYQDRKEVECKLEGTGNYTGELRLKYSILQKNIEDMTGDKYDIRFFTDKQEYPYQNGDAIEPVPRGEYNGLDLVGKRDSGGGAGSFDKDVPFVYTYPKDTTNVGVKTIVITGNGNFTGVRTLDYEITQLDLKDTKLEFTGSEAIYDGQEQHPSFKLTSEDGKQIAIYDGNSIKSDYIKKLKVTFENATNATRSGKLASITLSFDDKDGANSNYKGTKTVQFTIQPASLEGHVAFMYHPKDETGNIELKSNLHLPWTGKRVIPIFPDNIKTDTELTENQAGAVYDFAGKHNNGDFLIPAENEDATVGNGDYTLNFRYVEPDSDDTDVKEGYGDAPDCTFAGKVKVTITGINNYKDSASFWYYIGDDISADGSAKLQASTTVYNAQKQPPVVIVSGISRSKYNVERYKGEVKNENYIKSDKEIVDAATYYIRIEGNPSKGTYATKPITLTYTITPRPISNSVVIDGFKKEYNYTGLAICPVGISVTDYIDRTKYKLTENKDYSLTYANNINVGTATITVNGEGNFKGTGAARFAITSSMISSGNNGNPGGSVSNGSGQISGAVAVAPDDVRITLDAGDAMYYTGKQLTPAVTIDKMTQNTDYTVTYSNNIEVGTATVTITGMGNNTGTITKNFRIVAKLSDCKVTNIPDQKYTGSAVTPIVTVTCGNSILTRDKDYTVTYINNVEIGTATVKIRAANNPNYVGELEAKFNIGNNVGGFLVSGFAPTYPYTGNAVTPAVVVESGSTRLQQGTDYTIAYKDNVNAGTASIIVTGAGKYTGTQTVNFIIEPRSLQVCETTQVEDKTYTGDAYTPDIVVKDSGKVLEKGKDYTLTYADNVNPGVATIIIQGLSNNYTGIKKLTFRIGGVAVNGLKVSTVKATSIKLKWEQQGYADGYVVCDSNAKVVKRVKGNSATVTGLKPGKKYKYNVKSYTVNSQGEESYGKPSSVVSATTKLKTPTVTLKTTGKGKLRISWTKSTNADGYQIYYKNTKGAKFRKIKTAKGVNTRICNVRGIKSGKKCYVRVRAYKKSGSTTLKSSMSKTKTKKVK